MSKLLFPAKDKLASFEHQQLTIHICNYADGDTVLRRRLENSVARHFASVYGARVSQFMPMLLGIESNGEIQAVVGLRPASDGHLFLQQYLDQPIDRLIEQATAMVTCESSVIEVGNLVSRSPGMARLLITALTHYLFTCEFQWVAFTGTPLLLNSFSRLTLSPVVLADADPARLAHDAREWGSYYATRPKVMAGYIPEGFRQLQAADVFHRLSYLPHYNTHPQESKSRVCA